MNGIVCLCAVMALGVDYGWQPGTNGQTEYIIYIEPELLDSLQDGDELTSVIPAEVRGVRRFRIVIGNKQDHAEASGPESPPATATGSAPSAPISAPPGSLTASALQLGQPRTDAASSSPPAHANANSSPPSQTGANGGSLGMSAAGLPNTEPGQASDRPADEATSTSPVGGGETGEEESTASAEADTGASTSPDPFSQSLNANSSEPESSDSSVATRDSGTTGASSSPGSPVRPYGFQGNATDPSTDPSTDESPADESQGLAFGTGGPSASPSGSSGTNDTGRSATGTAPPRALDPAPDGTPLAHLQTGYDQVSGAETEAEAASDGRASEVAQASERGFDPAGPADESSPSDESPRAASAAKPVLEEGAGGEPERPWLPLTLTALGLFASLGANLYLGWMAWGFYRRYRELLDETRAQIALGGRQ